MRYFKSRWNPRSALGVTDATGAVTLPNVPAGPYVLEVQAAQHDTYRASFTVQPGITNNSEVFIAQDLVTYTWSVTPTTIQDTYQIQLQTTFQTDVPAPVVTIAAPDSLPTLQPGQSGQINVTLTNHGLIAADGVQLVLPTDPEYSFTCVDRSDRHAACPEFDYGSRDGCKGFASRARAARRVFVRGL